MGYQASWVFLADDVGGLLWVLQRMSRLSEVWKYSESSCISIKSHYQAMAIQGLGHRLDWPD
jgi:hypothetical protein